MWIQKRHRGNRHDLHSKTASGEMKKKNVDIYMTLVDVTKPLKQLVTMDSGKLWSSLAVHPQSLQWCGNVMKACRHVYKMMESSLSEPLEVTNEIKQGCVMAPTLFSMMFSAMLMDVFQDSDTGFPIRYRFNGNKFNLRRLLAKTKVQTDVLDELLYADDMDKNASSEANMQRAMDQVSQSCHNYDLTWKIVQ